MIVFPVIHGIELLTTSVETEDSVVLNVEHSTPEEHNGGGVDNAVGKQPVTPKEHTF